MYGRLRWLAVVAGVLLIGLVEVVSDVVVDSSLRFPFDSLLVMAVVAIVAFVAATLDFGQIDRLKRDLVSRNAELESRNAALRAVYEVSLAVSGRMDPHQTISSILDRTRQLLSVDAALLVLEDEPGHPRVEALSAGPGVVREREVVGAEGSGEIDYDALLREGYIVCISVPIVLGDLRLGSLELVTRRARTLPEPESGMVSALATQIGLALEADRLQEELRAIAVQGERERIAREMHDGLAQVLAYVSAKSQAADEMLVNGRVAEARSQLAELGVAARSLYVDVREAILTLSSPVSPEQGVAGALEEYAALYAESSKLAVRFEATPEARSAPLSAPIQNEVFRIAREALTNVRKHASAGRVHITLDRAGDQIVLLVEDDGVGFDQAVLNRGPDRWPHFGMAGMRERAESIGGSVAWRSTAGRGTTVELRVPVGGAGSSTSQVDLAPLAGTTRPASQHQTVRSSADGVSE